MDLPFDNSAFNEATPYAPSSPYSASKAAPDDLVRAWHHIFGLPVVLINCSNNYRPFHSPRSWSLWPSSTVSERMPAWDDRDDAFDLRNRRQYARAALSTIPSNRPFGSDRVRTRSASSEKAEVLVDRVLGDTGPVIKGEGGKRAQQRPMISSTPWWVGDVGNA